ncbi:MAG: hypothetical protein GWN61_02095, partial [candidate division Zixibacteria bacterium]|nr:hypothetical protein [candidate division Zixibacteria bacterium]NIR62777.1 hypothetical protein [candidate division Zixibacteria bacterium]NIS15915.1 hypothetical protein [candidate division Zixibacteria bacterium]NIS44847.1 hypothetical protein [candidate division Zixibacteria bacterium]NIU12940.1 hypothetical protein [candidate division Zixibacteria bacterium]
MSILKSKLLLLVAVLPLLFLISSPYDTHAQDFNDTDSILRLRSSSLWRGVNNLVVENGLIYALHESGFAVYDPQQGFMGVDTLAMIPL